MPHKLSLLIIITVATTATAWPGNPTIGVTLNHYPPSLTPESLVATVHRHRISSLRLTDPNPNIIRAFINSSVSLLLTIPNAAVHSISINRSTAAAWVDTHIVPFHPHAKITAVSVGSNATVDHLPAIRNLHDALHLQGIRNIQVSTIFSLNHILTPDSFFPPSLSQFVDLYNRIVIRPFIKFIQETDSFIMLDLSLYDLFRYYPQIPVGFALFDEGQFDYRDDSQGRYRNLFDTMVDSLQSAMTTAGYYDVPVVVAATGWPWSAGGDYGEDKVATMEYAEKYVKGLINHVLFDTGTPLNSKVIGVYIYELFDGEVSVGQRSGTQKRESQWGLLYNNSTSKYKKLHFNGANSRVDVRVYGFLRIIMLLIVFLMV